jgi:hypothetical protein
MVDAHTETVTVGFIEVFPEHAPRKGDPHYAAFNAMKRRMKKAGLLVCNVCGATEHIEVHHSEIEFSHAAQVDLDKLNKALGLHLTDEEFVEWVESPGNAEPLCVLHHRGQEGVHSLPEPQWNVVRLCKSGVVIATSNSEIPVVKETT